MKIAMICYSLTGESTGLRLKEGLEKLGHSVQLWKKSKYLPDSIKESCSQWTGDRFGDSQAVIFIGACGIAVRSIAPFVASKKTDPAVLVVDECSRFVISLLSGHLGGANELAGTAAKILDAMPVVTTATDLHQCFAVDVFAKKNDCGILNMKGAKEVSAALLAGERAGFFSDFPWEGSLPPGLVYCKDRQEAKKKGLLLGISVTVYKEHTPFEETVYVVPKTVALGMGCRKGKESEAVLQAANEILKKTGIFKEGVKTLASIDIKKEEPGLVALAEQWKIPFQVYTSEELQAVQGDFTPSSFVKAQVGVDNVCERSALLASGEEGVLIEKKQAAGGVTAALAAGNRRIRFE